jgi:polyhydroxybutyrate depolymerase
VNGCQPEPTVTPIGADVRQLAYACPADETVELYVVDGGGHTWPGSEANARVAAIAGPTTTTIDATDLILDFFEEHAATG